MMTLGVLAGGRGVRMGGPKDRLTAAGKPVLAGLLERLRWSGGTVLVAPHGGGLPVGSEAFDLVVRDAVADEGPLRGVLTALLASEGIVVVIPVDMPEIERGHLEWVGEQLAAKDSAIGVMLDRGGKIEPFPCAFRVEAAAVIQRRLESGRMSMHGLAEEEGVEVVSPPAEWGEDMWRNVNRPEDLPPGWRLGAQE